MLLLVILLAILLIGFILLAVFVEDSYDVWATVSSIVIGIALTLFVIVWAFNPYKIRIEIKKFEAFKQTLANARNADLSEYERAAIQSKIADWNEWIADVQYRKTWFINTMPDEVNDLKPIK